MTKKKSIRKPVSAKKRALLRELAEANRKDPDLIHTIRDGRVVIHWPETLQRLTYFKNSLSNYYGVSFAANPESTDYVRAMRQAAKAAGKWPICSCGSLCRAIPRYEDTLTRSRYGEPKDKVLRTHGIAFYKHIREGNLPEAERAMQKIEARATILLRQMGKKKREYASIS